jgi:hypothetical protein
MSIKSKVLVVSNFEFDNSTDLFRLLKKMKNDFKALPSYIDYVTYKDTNFLKFITTKYSQGYRMIIGNFYSSQCLSVFDFLNKHDDLLLISSASTVIFSKQMPSNLLRLASNDEKSFSLFKNKVLDSMNKILLMIDSTLTKFPRQKKIINPNEKTFVKTVNVLYTDEDIYNLSYVRMIKRTITGKEPYKFKFFKIDSATIKQNKLTPEASAILKTTDASNVFMIITISHAQEFLNIISSNLRYGIQMIFLSDSFASYNLKVKTQLPYSYTLINDILPNHAHYYQEILFNNNAGYIDYYTISILSFLKSHSELINNNILHDLSTKNMIEILGKSNEFINSQPVNNKKSIIRIQYASSIGPKMRPSPLPIPVYVSLEQQLQLARNEAIIYALSARITDSTISLKSLFNLYDKNVDDYKMYIAGLNYIKNNPTIIMSQSDYISELLTFKDVNNNDIDFDTFFETSYGIDYLYSYLYNLIYILIIFYDDTPNWSNELIDTSPYPSAYVWSVFNSDFRNFISDIISSLNDYSSQN